MPFDDGLLDDEEALAAADWRLREIAEAGARVRRESVAAAEVLEYAVRELGDDRPRAILAAGPDSRLLRAVLEPSCPVPFQAWPGPGLPGWAGSLDLVVVLAPLGDDLGTAVAVAEAVRRGCQLVVAAPAGSLVADHARGRHVVHLPTQTKDQLGTAVVMLDLIDRLGLGPATDPEAVAQALDDVAVAAGPHRDLAINPAKILASGIADTSPLLWGGSVLSARAARRVAESFRRASGRAALAADAEHLLPVIANARQADVFADPFADPDDAGTAPLRPSLIVLDDGQFEAATQELRAQLLETAEQHRVRVETISSDAPGEVARYAALLGMGTFAAAYLQVGLG